MGWKVVYSDEIRTWILDLPVPDAAVVKAMVDRLEIFGNRLRMPHGRSSAKVYLNYGSISKAARSPNGSPTSSIQSAR